MNGKEETKKKKEKEEHVVVTLIGSPGVDLFLEFQRKTTQL